MSRGQLRRREAGWGAAGGERAACRLTNPIRRGVAASFLDVWRSLGPKGTDRMHGGDKERDIRAHNVVGGWMP